MMTFTFTPTFKEQYIASLTLQVRSLFYLLFLIFFPTVSLLFLFLTFGTGRTPSPGQWIVIVLGPIFMPAVTAFNVWSHRLQNSSAIIQQTYSFDDVGLKAVGSLFQTELKWSAFNRVVETNRFFLFYFSRWTAYYLPKNVIAKRELDPLRSLLRKQMGSNAHLLL